MRAAILAGALTLALALPATAAEPAVATLDAPAPPPASEPNYDLVKNQPVQDPLYPDTGFAETDVLHYKLGFAWNGDTLKAIANIKVRATKATTTTRFNLGKPLAVSDLTVNGRKATFTHEGRTLTVTHDNLAAESFNDFVITYGGKPKSVAMPSDRGGQLGWVVKGQSVSTLQEPYGAYTWYPCNDHPSDKAFYDVRITTKDGLVGVFNGVLQSKTSQDGNTQTIFKLDSPAASYLTTIAIDPFKLDEQKMADGKMFYIWHTSADERSLPGWRRETKRAYDWLTSKVGPNAFSSMGMVITSSHSAMETQTMMTMGRDLMRSSAQSLIIHEMAHQWFGDTVTTKTWRDTWLNEGWTMYLDDEYSGSLNPQRAGQTCAGIVGRAGQAGNPRADQFAMPNVYQCPIPAIHQVRTDVGDAKFFQVAAGWPAQHKFQSQDRAAFDTYLQKATGKDYSPVFATWLDNVGSSARTAHDERIHGAGNDW